MINNKNFLLSLGYSVIILAASIELISTIFFLSGVSISAFNFWVPCIVTIIFLRFMSMYNKESPNLFIWNLGVLAGIFIIGAFFSYLFYDLSYDGQAYQQEGIIQLANGWNPYTGIPVEGYIHDLWINHYAKGPWILAAAFYKVTGLIETSKVFNFAFLISSFFIAMGTLSRLFPKQTGKVIVLALVLAFNPIVLVQLTTFYIDGQLYSLLLIIFCLAFLLFKEYRPMELVMLCLTILLLVNVKFTALGYVGVVGISYLVVLFIFKKKDLIKRILWPVVITFVIAIAVVGYNPYVKNTIENGNPFYPLAGKGAVDIMTTNSPANFVNANPIKNLARSIFSTSDNALTPSHLKIPFTIKQSEINAFLAPDVRVGGFGPLFGGAVLAALAVLLVSMIQDRKKVWYIIFPGAILLASVLINKEAWWARYTPQLWIAPILVAIFAFLTKKRTSTFLAWGLLILLIVNTVLISQYNFKEQYQLSRQVDKQLDELASKDTVIQVKLNNSLSNRIRFQERNIKHTLVNDLKCSNPKSFPLSEAQYCE